MENRELIVLLPAYNEENDVRKLVERWEQQEAEINRYHLALKIVVINDGSQDQTKDICEQLEQAYPNIKLINHEENKGLGKAVETGFRYVVQSCPWCAYACVMDCDNTQSPEYINAMLQKVKDQKADVVIASRYQKGAKVHGLASYRKWTSQGARWVYSGLFRVNDVRDYTCGYRLYSAVILKEAFECYGRQFVEEKGFTCMAEILYKLDCIGAVFTEIPFELHYDAKNGASKMKVFHTAKDSILLALRLRRLPRKERHYDEVEG